jgi:hypothetical protein
MTDLEFESRVRRFEQAWRLHGPSAIVEYLGESFAPVSPRRGRLLTELICVDLEYRWRNSAIVKSFSLQAYVERFPELVSLDQLPIDLIGEAYRVRHRWGDQPSHAEFMSPFRESREEIQEELVRIDAELEEEAEPGDASRSPSRGLPEPGPADESFEVLGVYPFSCVSVMLRHRLSHYSKSQLCRRLDSCPLVRRWGNIASTLTKFLPPSCG